VGCNNKNLLGMDTYNTRFSNCWIIDVSPSELDTNLD
jgi:hypothetical protein